MWQVYSLDWDKQYLEDEAALREAGGYDAADTQLLDPLVPGAPLWPDLTLPSVSSTDGPQLAPPEADDTASSNLGRLLPPLYCKRTTLSLVWSLQSNCLVSLC